ncbi:MAG: GNAT family N-acetyltransferase [Pseudomonadales bacterium]|nr:GNAT family N-acetyltransferase [Pseudomonadales bacterium]
MEVKLVENDEDLIRIAPVLLELRTHFKDEAELIAQIKQQQQYGYNIAYVESDGDILCIAGFVIDLKLAWGKHIYVDDLVTTSKKRSSGAGKTIMDWLKQHCRDNKCTQLHLDSGVQRFAAHKFYLREGFIISSHHFSINDIDDY